MKAPQLDREDKIALAMLVIVVGFVASVIYHHVLAAWFGLGYPYNTPLFSPGDSFSDYTNYIRLNRDLNPYLGTSASFASTYYPLTNLVFYLFSLRSGTGQTAAMPVGLYSLLFALALVWFSSVYLKADDHWRYLTRVFVFSFMTYPVLFALDRGNIETLLLILLLAFIYFFQRRRFWISSVFLALAIAMKLYPLFLLVLFVPEKKYREIGFTVALSVVLTIACLMCFKGGFLANLRFLLTGANVHTFYYDAFVGYNNLVQRGVSLFTVIKVLLIETGGIAGVDMARLMSCYVVLAAAAAVLVAAYVIFIERELWRMVGLLVFAVLLLPTRSADYRMILLLIPLFLFFNAAEQSRADVFYALLFALLLIPKDYYLLPKTLSDDGAHDISIAVFLNPAIMMLMSSMIMASGLRRWRKSGFLLQFRNLSVWGENPT
jgi:hypothetical protein